MVTKTEKRNFKIIEDHLRNYKLYKAGIHNFKRKLDYIMPNITSSYELREGSVGVFTFKSDTEKYAIDRIESKRALDIVEEMKRYQLIIDSIDKTLRDLKKEERDFVIARYIEDQSMEKVSQQMNVSLSSAYEFKNEVRKRLLIGCKDLVLIP
ncbi:sigma-70 family RNA polymerase sigma factor [Fictibacillus sp. NRS-1165]|uniref:sigma-70 family RNA polymerase sigma factor n=1 Tax=Fictibacillus sp. NRS-1165 TaxID=3144463 RepID=UPI003D1E5273